MGVAQSSYTPNTPHTTTAPSLASTNIYFISLTFFLGPDEVAIAWLLWKFVCNYNAIYFVSAIKQFT